MKNYGLNEFVAETFILNYEIKDNNLIIYHGKGSYWQLPYNETNEKKILELMKNQIIKAQKFHEIVESKYYMSIKLIISDFALLYLNNTIMPMASIFYIIFGFTSIGFIIDMINNKIKLNDILKNELYIEQEDILKQRYNINVNSLDRISYKDLKRLINDCYPRSEDNQIYIRERKKEITE